MGSEMCIRDSYYITQFRNIPMLEGYVNVISKEDKGRYIEDENKTIEFMFAGINMFWDRLRLILARAVRRGLK